jgi:hypothetical protein
MFYLVPNFNELNLITQIKYLSNMITEERLKMNERFVKVFNMLVDRGDIVMNDRDGRGIGDFAAKIIGNRGYGHIIRAFLNTDDKRVVDYHHVKALCRHYGVNENYITKGTGTPFGIDLPVADIALDSLGIKPNIMFTSARAFAGDTIGAEASEDTQYFGIPGISGGEWVSFTIDGNSMDPVIKDGDVVICRKIESINDIKENDIYAVKSNGKLWVKHVQPIRNLKKRVVSLRMVSANYLEYGPFEEDVNEYTQLFKVMKRISAL